MNPIFLIVGGVILLILIASVKFFRVLFFIGLIGVSIYFIAVPGAVDKIIEKVEGRQIVNVYHQNHHRNRIPVNCNNNTTTRSYSISNNNYHENSNNQIIEDAQRQINNIGDAFLGKGTTEKITNIVNDDNRTPEQAAKDIIREIPTGLPKIVDNYVKGMVGKMLDASTK